LVWRRRGNGSNGSGVEISNEKSTAIFRVDKNFPGGVEWVKLTATDETSSTDSIRLRIEVLGEPPDISGMPCWILWNKNASPLDFTEPKYGLKNVDKIEWGYGEGEIQIQLFERTSDGKTVEFNYPEFSDAKKRLITYTASNSDGLQKSPNRDFTIVVLPSQWICEKDGDTLNLISDIECQKRKIKLIWSLPNPLPDVATLDGLQFKCTGKASGVVSIEAHDIERYYT